ncbi:MAG: KamA family radical SAM protein, partial [Gemmatimonadales bacterium]
MAEWQKLLHDRGIRTLAQLVERFGPEHFPDLDRLQAAVDNFEFRISPAMVDLIQEPGDPIWRQYVPDLHELEVVDGVLDSLNEDEDSPVPNITHRYPDRALFLVSPVCAAYCRFCTRRRKVGDPEKIPLAQLESAFSYLEAHTEIRDVILSGGDPLLLSDRRLGLILGRLRSIPHIQIIRIGSRVPCHLPERITDGLCGVLSRHHPIYINTHFNHPVELTPAAVEGLGKLADAGVPMGCQTVLLRGVNDDVETMRELMQRLLVARVRPYYIFMCDNVAGVEHFKTDVEKGLEIIEGLRGWTSGLAVPHFVIDAPGGGGKIPLLPEYVERITEDEVVMRNYRGEQYSWKQPREEVLVAVGSR